MPAYRYIDTKLAKLSKDRVALPCCSSSLWLYRGRCNVQRLLTRFGVASHTRLSVCNELFHFTSNNCMMKFAIRRSSCTGNARLGFISELQASSNAGVDIETPAFWVYTRRGSIPHLAADVLKVHGLTSTLGERVPIVVPLTSTIDLHSAVQKFARGIGEFVGLKDHIVYTSVQDPSMAVPSGYNDKAGISVWPRCGRMQMDVAKFMQIQEAFRPDVYQALCDSDTGPTASKKRTRKAVDRSLELLDDCIERHFKSKVLKDTAIFGSVQGGCDVAMRKISAVQTALRPVSGFVIDGFYNYGEESEKLEFRDVHDTLISTLEFLPPNKPRIMHGIWKPANVVQAVEVGIDLFDSSYPCVLADRGVAFVLPLSHFEVDTKSKAADFSTDNDCKCELDLTDKNASDDFSPLMDGCSCYTCRRFTRAYVNHLLNTSEMLAQVLLTIHNVHHYGRFFEVIRAVMNGDRFQQFKQYVMSK